MKELEFKTSLKCNGCISKVQPKIEKLEGFKSIEFDLEDDDKLLIVSGDVNANSIIEIVEEAGFIIEEL